MLPIRLKIERCSPTEVLVALDDTYYAFYLTMAGIVPMGGVPRDFGIPYTEQPGYIRFTPVDPEDMDRTEEHAFHNRHEVVNIPPITPAVYVKWFVVGSAGVALVACNSSGRPYRGGLLVLVTPQRAFKLYQRVAPRLGFALDDLKCLRVIV